MKKTILSLFLVSIAALQVTEVVAQPIPGGLGPVITEIMYNPPESSNDTLEFIEILNPSLTGAVNMTGFYIEDAFSYNFPDGFMLGAGEHVIIAGDSVIFEAAFGVEAFEWEGATTQLNNSGEPITLKDGVGVVVDSVDYGNSGSWPTEANGQGYSLVLCDPSSDNSLAENWTISEDATGVVVNALEIYASPGEVATCTTIGIADDNVITTLVYPNPSAGEFRVQFDAQNTASTLRIYNSVGQTVFTESVAAGVGVAQLYTNLKAGHYILSIDNGETSERLKLTIR